MATNNDDSDSIDLSIGDFLFGTLAYVVAVPKQGEKFTEFYILGPDGKAITIRRNTRWATRSLSSLASLTMNTGT